MTLTRFTQHRLAKTRWYAHYLTVEEEAGWLQAKRFRELANDEEPLSPAAQFTTARINRALIRRARRNAP